MLLSCGGGGSQTIPEGKKVQKEDLATHYAAAKENTDKVDALSVAYDRTVTNTGCLKWNYMKKIVSSWHQKGIHTVQEIEEKDRRTPTPAKNTEPNAPASQAELARLRSIYEKVKNT